MKYPASETRKIITLVKHSHVPAKLMLDRLVIADKCRFGFIQFSHTRILGADRFNVKRGKRCCNFFWLVLIVACDHGFFKKAWRILTWFVFPIPWRFVRRFPE
jgi:hypothetical protein